MLGERNAGNGAGSGSIPVPPQRSFMLGTQELLPSVLPAQEGKFHPQKRGISNHGCDTWGQGAGLGMVGLQELPGIFPT